MWESVTPNKLKPSTAEQNMSFKLDSVQEWQNEEPQFADVCKVICLGVCGVCLTVCWVCVGGWSKITCCFGMRKGHEIERLLAS